MTETKINSPTAKLESPINGKHDIINIIKRKYTKMKHNTNKFMMDTTIYENMNQAIKYLISHPILLTICICIIAALVIPVLSFVIFIVINIAFAFIGFIIIIVTVLTIGIMVVCSILCSTIITIALIGIAIVLTCSLLSYLLTKMSNFKIAP